MEMRELSAAELVWLQAEFNASGDLVDFHAPATAKFNLQNTIRDYDNGADLVDAQLGDGSSALPPLSVQARALQQELLC